MDCSEIKIPFRAQKTVLALGGHLKNTVCAIEGSRAYLSRPSGDLSGFENFRHFKKAAVYFFKKFKPPVIACDAHPEYLSTRFAAELAKGGCRIIKVQHHHAHIASCIADNLILPGRRVIGVAFDGTGAGSDNNIWGAEFLIAGYKAYKRAGHFRYVRMPGAETAVSRPWKMAFSHLYDAYAGRLNGLGLPMLKKLNPKDTLVLKKAMDSGFNCPLASSAGRLFDAAAAIIGLGLAARFEAELALGLEKLADKRCEKRYDFDITRQGGLFVVDTRKIIRAIVSDKIKRTPDSRISARFHNTMADIIIEACKRIRQDAKINSVALSGGVFQNKYLFERAVRRLGDAGFDVLAHRHLPPTDAGLSLGQAVAAC